MANLTQLRAANDRIETQMQEWQTQRHARGEDHQDWQTFRQHVQAIGAPDPGEVAPEEFTRWQPAESSDGDRSGGTDSSDRGQTGGRQISEVNSLHPSPSAVGDTATWPASAGSGTRTSKWPTPRSEDAEARRRVD